MEKVRSKLLWRNHREYQWLLFENFQIALLVFSADLNKVPARGKQKKGKDECQQWVTTRSHLSCQALHTWPRNPLIYFFRTGICKYLLAFCLKTQSCNVTQVNLELNYVAKDNPELPIFCFHLSGIIGVRHLSVCPHSIQLIKKESEQIPRSSWLQSLQQNVPGALSCHWLERDKRKAKLWRQTRANLKQNPELSF